MTKTTTKTTEDRGPGSVTSLGTTVHLPSATLGDATFNPAEWAWTEDAMERHTLDSGGHAVASVLPPLPTTLHRPLWRWRVFTRPDETGVSEIVGTDFSLGKAKSAAFKAAERHHERHSAAAAAMAFLLDGAQVGNEITSAQLADANAHGLVILFVGNDSHVRAAGFPGYFERACPPAGCGGAGTEGPNRVRIAGQAADSRWCFVAGMWTFKTEMPHATFETSGTDGPWCQGIVVDIEDARKMSRAASEAGRAGKEER